MGQEKRNHLGQLANKMNEKQLLHLLLVCPVCEEEEEDDGLRWIQCDLGDQCLHLECSDIPPADYQTVQEVRYVFVYDNCMSGCLDFR